MSLFIAAAAMTVAALATPARASEGWSECTEMWVEAGWYPSEVEGAARVCRANTIAISYDTKMIDPAYSAYYVTPERVANLITGRDTFYADPDLKAMGIVQAAYKSDAFNTSWNRGHLAPSHILSWSDDTKYATYTMANIAPQGAKFNQRAWVDLETNVVEYIGSSGNALHIVTGVAYHSRSDASRTFDNIAVPDYYWKVLCDKSNGQSVGFYGHNTDVASTECLTPHAVSEIEALYGGAILPSVCNPNKLDKTHWWSF
jgi:endonuclease G